MIDGGDESTGGDDPTAAPEDGPAILAFPPTVARGGLMYFSSDTAISQIIVEVDGAPLEVEHILQTEVPTGLLRLPAASDLGVLPLQAKFRGEAPGLTEVDLEVVEAAFVDVAPQAGVGGSHNAEGAPRECAYSHTGVAFGDYDGDGETDLFVGHFGSGSVLYRGRGGAQFEDVTEAAGLAGTDAAAMAEFVDIEGDGDLDLFVGRRGTNRLFENRVVPDGEARFVDIAASVGLGSYSQRTMGVAFGDSDSDGDLDLYVVNHAFCFPSPGSEIRANDHLYRNEDGIFVEKSAEMGGEVMSSVGFSASWVDTDRDGDQDLIVINDDVGGAIGSPNGHWRNDGPGEGDAWLFADISEPSGIGIRGVNGMGLGLGDINHDGFVDVAFSNIGPNQLLINRGDGTFANVSEQAGIERARLPWDQSSITWATDLFDMDNDGELDLYFSGGRIKGEILIPDAIFRNIGNAQFEETTWFSGIADPESAKAAALADFNHDGTWDLAVTAWDAPFRLYQGVPSGNHWLDVELVGTGANRAALGAIVELTAGGVTQTCFHTNRPSLGAGGEIHCHFGLAQTTTIDALRVIWPNGDVSDHAGIGVDTRVVLEHNP